MGKIRQLVLAWSSQSAHNHHGCQNTTHLHPCGHPDGGWIFHSEDKRRNSGGRRGGQGGQQDLGGRRRKEEERRRRREEKTGPSGEREETGPGERQEREERGQAGEAGQTGRGLSPCECDLSYCGPLPALQSL